MTRQHRADGVARQPDSTVDVLARTLWGEARGEGETGMRAVASVVMNRTKSRLWFGGDVASVCLKPYQFSCWNVADPNRSRLLLVDDRDPAFRTALKVASDYIGGEAKDITGNATHYFSDRIPLPSWTRGGTFCKKIGHHLFYRNIA